MNPSSEQTRQTPVDLRRQAERRVQTPPSEVSRLSAEEVRRLVYELEIHQEELEIQNEELRRAHIELLASRERYADLYDFAPVGYLTLDCVGKILQTNLMAANMLGLDRSSIMNRRLGQFCVSESKICLRDHLESIRTSGQRQQCQLEFAAPNGTVCHVRLDTNPITQIAENVWQCRVIMTDITERTVVERALAEKDNHLKSVTNALPVLIAYIDRDLNFQLANLAYLDWFGCSPGEMAGRKVHDVIGEESANEIADYFFEALAGRRVDFETQLVHRSTGRRHVQMMLIPDFDANGSVKGLHSLSLDITDRIVVEEQRARRRDYAERLTRLNEKERAIYDLLVQGKSNRAIATELKIGLRTAERRRKVMLEKLSVESLAELLQQLAKSNE